jgi:Ni2+-binding GTPase involved in maturation of urease and hydrogenase
LKLEKIMTQLTVSIIQTDLVWENKAANLENLERKIMGIKERTELVILPEMFSTGFSMNTDALAEEMEATLIDSCGCCPTASMDITTKDICLDMLAKTNILLLEIKD